MALINDPRMFQGGSERFDTRPHVALYAQLKAREQAKNDAYDEYIRNLNKNVNPAGMRNQEREVFEDKLKRWQEYGMQNREALRNPRKDGGQASMQFQAGYQDLQNTIAESKTREEGKKPIVPLILDPDKRDRMDEGFMQELSYHDAPLYVRDAKGNWVRNPDSRPIDITKLDFTPKPFDQEKFSRGLDDVKASQSTQAIKKLPGFKEEVTTTSVFSPEDKEVVAYRTIGQYGQDKSFKKFIKDLPVEERQSLAKLYETEFKQPATDDAQLAAAYGLKIKQENAVKREIKDDTFAQRKEMAALNDAYAKGRMYMRRAWSKADKATQDTWVDGQIEGIIAKGKQGGEVVYTDENDNKRLGFKLPLDPTMAKALTRDKREPDALRLNSDGTIQPVFLKRDDNGNAIRGKNGEYEVNKTLSVPLTRDQIRAAYSKQFGVKQANLEMGGMDGEDGGESSSGSTTIGILD